jgi:hypothetical protein
MVTAADINKALERTLEFTANVDNPLEGSRSIIERITDINDRINVVEQEVNTKGILFYHGYEDEDIEE